MSYINTYCYFILGGGACLLLPLDPKAYLTPVCCTGCSWPPTQNSASGKGEGHRTPHNCQISRGSWILVVITVISLWQIDFLLISSFSYHRHEKFCYLCSSLWHGTTYFELIHFVKNHFLSLLWMSNLLASFVPHPSCIGEGRNLPL